MATNIYIVKPVYKALQVLQRLAEAQRAMSLAEISRHTRLPKTTVFRYLCTLRELNFVAHDPETDLYRLGMYAWKLGQLAGEELQIRMIARPVMEALRDRFDETVNLGTLDGSSVVYVEVVESRRSLRIQPRPGAHDPVYSTALGKAILAFLPEKQWHLHLPAQLTARTSRTLTTSEALKQDLVVTRERGYATDQGENEEGGRCVGVPIFDQQRRVIAAISLSAPASRMDDVVEQDVVAALMAAATSCSSRLGHYVDATPVNV